MTGPKAIEPSKSRAGLAFLVVFLLLAAGFVTTGLFYYRSCERRHRAEVEQQLSTIAGVKVADLARWRRERLVDGGIRERLGQVAFLIGALLLGAGAGVGLVWRQQRVRFYRERAETGNEARRMATVVRDSNDAITIQDFEGRITAWNRGAERMNGYGEAEALAMSIERLTAPGKVEEQRDFTRRLLGGEAVTSLETQRVTRDGRTLDVWLTVTKLIDDAGTPIGVASTERDITARKRVEDALRQSEQKYRGLFESSRDAIMTLEPPSWKFATGNPAAVKLFGAKNEAEFVSHAPWELSPERQPDGRLSAEKAREITEMVLREGSHYFEWTHRRIGGEEFSASVLVTRMKQGNKVLLQATVRDITERRLAEQALRDSQALYSSLVENLPQSVFRKDREGRFLFVNQRFCEGVSHSLEEIVGKTDADLFPPQLAAAYRQDDLCVMESGQVLDQVEEHIGADGRKMYVQVVKTPLFSASRTVIGVQGIFWDITEQKKLEEQFLRAQRLEAVGTMAGGIAHDLNNILAPILMGAPMLRGGFTPAEMAPTLDAIESSAQRAAEVVRQLLTFSRGQSGQRITLHLKHLLRDLRSIIRETFPKNIMFTLSEAPGLWPLVADPTQLHQILLNLCINARDAMPDGGTLAVTTANFKVDDHYAGMVPDARPGPYTHLQVSDTGDGIRPEDLDNIFDPFFTTKEVGKGTGLGLATVHRVVASHGGFVRVHSQVGKGTTFDVYLPASPEAVALDKPASPAATLRGHGELILVVDDEAPIRQMTERTLLQHGYRAVTAADGTDAVLVFAQYQAEIRAVLTDLMMPGMDGLGLVKVLTQMKPGLPVILSTGVGDDPERHQTFAAMGQLGVSIMLTKPYAADELLEALHAVLPAK